MLCCDCKTEIDRSYASPRLYGNYCLSCAVSNGFVDITNEEARLARELYEVVKAMREECQPSEWHRGYNDALVDISKLIKRKYLRRDE